MNVQSTRGVSFGMNTKIIGSNISKPVKTILAEELMKKGSQDYTGVIRMGKGKNFQPIFLVDVLHGDKKTGESMVIKAAGKDELNLIPRIIEKMAKRVEADSKAKSMFEISA